MAAMHATATLTLALTLALAACTAPPRAPVVARAADDMPFCTRTLGQTECFADPSALNDTPRDQADTPVRLIQPVPWWQVFFPH